MYIVTCSWPAPKHCISMVCGGEGTGSSFWRKAPIAGVHNPRNQVRPSAYVLLSFGDGTNQALSSELHESGLPVPCRWMDGCPCFTYTGPRNHSPFTILPVVKDEISMVPELPSSCCSLPCGLVGLGDPGAWLKERCPHNHEIELNRAILPAQALDSADSRVLKLKDMTNGKCHKVSAF